MCIKVKLTSYKGGLKRCWTLVKQMESKCCIGQQSVLILLNLVELLLAAFQQYVCEGMCRLELMYTHVWEIGVRIGNYGNKYGEVVNTSYLVYEITALNLFLAFLTSSTLVVLSSSSSDEDSSSDSDSFFSLDPT